MNSNPVTHLGRRSNSAQEAASVAYQEAIAEVRAIKRIVNTLPAALGKLERIIEAMAGSDDGLGLPGASAERRRRGIEPAFLRPDMAARYLGVSRRCLANWTSRGLVPVSRMGSRMTLYATADLRAAVGKFRVGRPP